MGEKESPGINAVQTDNLKSLLGIRIYRILNLQIRDFCGVRRMCMKVISGGFTILKGK